MAGIIFYYEDVDTDVWSDKKFDAWNYACKLSNSIDKAIIINKTDDHVTSFDKGMDIQIVKEMPEVDGHKTQLVCPWNFWNDEKIPLWEFDHETDWYLFGPAIGWNEKSLGDVKVYIPQLTTVTCHSVHVCTTVLFHRYGVLNK